MYQNLNTYYQMQQELYISLLYFVRQYKLDDVKGRLDYVSNPDRQEHLFASFDTAGTDTFGDYLAGESQKAFKQSRAKGKCLEARELVIMHPRNKI